MSLEAYLKIKKEISPKVCLIAVSKGQPIQKIISLYNAGHRDFGETFTRAIREKCKPSR